MVDRAAVASSLIGCFDASRFVAEPFGHWLLENILPAEACEGVDAIPVAPPKIDNTLGKRETHNSSRLFLGAENHALSRMRRGRRRLPERGGRRSLRTALRRGAARELSAHRILPRHRRLLARAAH